MAQINVADLTFCYEGSFDNIFENASFSIDTNWKLGLIGRNGKGKTTFANLLLGKYEYTGSVVTSGTVFDYFPYHIDNELMNRSTDDFLEIIKPGCESWRVICELNKLEINAEVLYRPFHTLSHGERTKVMLAILFSRENDFLMIDEPTNHLDYNARQTVKEYLQKKKGFLLISHDRDLLDACVDHVLVLNRKSIEVQAGNFSVWWENKKKKDAFSEKENEKHLREIASLKRAADKTTRWADKNENTKIGYNPVKEHDRSISARAYIGTKTKKMQSRVKSYETRMEREIEEKEGLLADIERPIDLKLMPLEYHKELLIYTRDYCFKFPDAEEFLIQHFDFELKAGERVFLHGSNGCGKSTFIKQILGEQKMPAPVVLGELTIGAGLVISYVNQDTSFLCGSIKEYCKTKNLDESLMLAILRQLDMERVQFQKPMESYSEGQKKKVLLAASLLTPAHLYIWDEPLNYIDVFSRMQIEQLILKYQPTMLIVDHDVAFRNNVATRIVDNFKNG
ncbi:MAG: ATP-binding cassette domain-containing protein [Lachnospiraceae bacterium]|nr:ATP-binding cassette domain-containing protein [Lachnospiraceae bacterium]